MINVHFYGLIFGNMVIYVMVFVSLCYVVVNMVFGLIMFYFMVLGYIVMSCHVFFYFHGMVFRLIMTNMVGDNMVDMFDDCWLIMTFNFFMTSTGSFVTFIFSFFLSFFVLSIAFFTLCFTFFCFFLVPFLSFYTFLGTFLLLMLIFFFASFTFSNSFF